MLEGGDTGTIVGVGSQARNKKQLLEMWLTCFNRLIGTVVGSIINLVGAKEMIFLILFKTMGKPPCYPRHGKDGCKEIRLDPQLMVNDAGVKIYVGRMPFGPTRDSICASTALARLNRDCVSLWASNC